MDVNTNVCPDDYPLWNWSIFTCWIKLRGRLESARTIVAHSHIILLYYNIILYGHGLNQCPMAHLRPNTPKIHCDLSLQVICIRPLILECVACLCMIGGGDNSWKNNFPNCDWCFILSEIYRQIVMLEMTKLKWMLTVSRQWRESTGLMVRDSSYITKCFV